MKTMILQWFKILFGFAEEVEKRISIGDIHEAAHEVAALRTALDDAIKKVQDKTAQFDKQAETQIGELSRRITTIQTHRVHAQSIANNVVGM